MGPYLQQNEVAAGTGEIATNSPVDPRDETNEKVEGSTDGNDSRERVLPIQRGEIPNPVLSSGSDNGNETESKTEEKRREPVEREPTDDKLERGEVLQTETTNGGKSGQVAQQAVINITTMEVQPVEWPGYPTLGESGGFNVAQVIAFKPGKGWVKLVPILSGEDSEIVFPTKYLKFSMVAAIEAIAEG